MSFDNVYESLTEDNDAGWAFGELGDAGASPAWQSDSPLSGMDTTVPAAVAGSDLAEYCLMLGDDALVFSQRLQEWITKGPELEDEVALANIALDLLGQARLLLARAGAAEGNGRTEEDLAYHRDAAQFRNVVL
ncbi:MAG: Phenylacetic acid catabolic protein, partial [Sciscionella sp.]